MAEFRRATHRLLGGQEPPETLWVVHSTFTRAMCEPRPEPHLDLGSHYDWLLAAGPDQLGLFRVRGPRLAPDDLVFTADYGDVQYRFDDVGALARSRVMTIAKPGEHWFAVTAHLTGAHGRQTERFSEVLAERIGGPTQG